MYAVTASRVTNPGPEWEFAHFAFERIEKEFGPFSINLYALKVNKLVTFFSRSPVSEAEFAVLFTDFWKDEKFYAFSSLMLILLIAVV